MPEEKKFEIAQAAKMIVDGYAFLEKGANVTIVNLNKNDEHVCVIDKRGKVLETCMDPIEQVIALKIWNENREFMEEDIA